MAQPPLGQRSEEKAGDRWYSEPQSNLTRPAASISMSGVRDSMKLADRPADLVDNNSSAAGDSDASTGPLE
jgi:hypothetical protein